MILGEKDGPSLLIDGIGDGLVLSDSMVVELGNFEDASLLIDRCIDGVNVGNVDVVGFVDGPPSLFFEVTKDGSNDRAVLVALLGFCDRSSLTNDDGVDDGAVDGASTLLGNPDGQLLSFEGFEDGALDSLSVPDGVVDGKIDGVVEGTDILLVFF